MRTRVCAGILALAMLLVFVPALTSCDLISMAIKRKGAASQSAQATRIKTAQPAATAPPAVTPTATPGATRTPSGTRLITAGTNVSILERALEETSVPLMDGRLTVKMPAGAEDVARQADIMSAKASSRAETRLILEGNGQKLVVFAREMFLYSDDVQADLDKLLKSDHGDDYSYTSQCIRDTDDGFKLIWIAPDNIKTGEDSVLIREAFAAMPDHTLISLQIFVTPETFADRDQCLILADEILDSVQPGERTLDLSAREETINDNITIQLDKDYTIVEDIGADFFVYYLMKFMKYNERYPSIGIYFGEHPTMQFSTRNIAESDMKKTKGSLLNVRATWLEYRYPSEDGLYCAEAVLSSSGSYMHVFVDATSGAELQQIKDMLKSMRFK